VDDPFNEFTRYSPSGPGKDKFKKNCQQAFGQATGDDTLGPFVYLNKYFLSPKQFFTFIKAETGFRSYKSYTNFADLIVIRDASSDIYIS
jgi:hypothetical protein